MNLHCVGFMAGLLLATSATTAHSECATVKDCAQEAVEAALTARAQIDLFLPRGAVIAFALDECPKPYWEEYKPAYGRFVRGIDRSDNPIDPNRKVGDHQESEVGGHDHGYQMRNGGHRTCADGGGSVCELHQFEYGTSAQTTSRNSGSETRPANVALLYCVKK